MSRWSPKTATREITKIATSKKMTISYCLHAKERLAERNIIISDVLHVLRYGIVQQDPQPSTREAFNKYLVESKSPNSENRTIGVVVIPDSKACFLKVVTVEWMDDCETRAGSIIGEVNE